MNNDTIKRGIAKYKKEIDKIMDKRSQHRDKSDTASKVYMELSSVRLEKIRKQLDRYKDQLKSESLLEKLESLLSKTN